MNLNILKMMLDKKTKRYVIGMKLDDSDTHCEIIGLKRSKDKLTLMLIHSVSEELLEKAFELQSRRPTRREMIKQHWSATWDGPLNHVGKIFIDGCAFEVNSRESRRFESSEWESVIELYEFMRAGWNAEGFESSPTENMMLTQLHLEGKESRKIKASPSSQLRFENRPYSISHFVELPMILKIGEDYPERVWFTDTGTGEKHWTQIHKVYLMDIYETFNDKFNDPRITEQFDAEQIIKMKQETEASFSKICPRGMFLPVIEYECEEAISLQFYHRDDLDQEPVQNSGAVGFIMGTDKTAGKWGQSVKACVVQSAMPADTKEIHVELFQYSRHETGGLVVS